MRSLIATRWVERRALALARREFGLISFFAEKADKDLGAFRIAAVLVSGFWFF